MTSTITPVFAIKNFFNCMTDIANEQVLEVSTKVLRKLKISHVIGKAVWDQGGDIRKEWGLLPNSF